VTLVLAWLRNLIDVQELVIAADSRLTAPFQWDCAPKIMPLQRADCAICFAGPTWLTYPFMLQVQNTLRLHPKSLSRGVDLYDFKGHILEVINGMREWMSDFPSSREAIGEADTYFILAGYSWRRGDFAIWTLHYQKGVEAFTFREATNWAGVDGTRRLAIIGDARGVASDTLTAILTERGKRSAGGFDMEPLEALVQVIRGKLENSIGGSPQVVKVYRHMNTQAFGVYWPHRSSGQISVLGRPLLSYEEPNTGVIDPDTMEVVPANDARVV
jgi:hypothetical protein